MVSGPSKVGVPREDVVKEADLLEAMAEKFLSVYKGDALEIHIPLERDVKKYALPEVIRRYKNAGWPSVETKTEWGKTYLILSRAQVIVTEGKKDELKTLEPYYSASSA